VKEVTNPMIRLLKNRWALSTVITTLIILVVSVLLASVVTYFAINVVNTRVQEESLNLTNQHIWVNSTAAQGSANCTIAAIMVVNTGGRDVVINEIAVRGQASPWNGTTAPGSEKFVVYSTISSAITADLGYVPNFNYTGGINHEVLGGIQYNFTVANNNLVLKSGNVMLIYVINPDSISVSDVGLTTSIVLHSAQAMYYKETNVEAVTSS
jgi:hypothetical protein